MIIEHLRSEGVWPTFAQLDRRVDVEIGADLVELVEVTPAQYMPIDGIDVNGRRDTELCLTHIALHKFGADDLLRTLVRALAFAAEREQVEPLSPNGTVELTAERFLDALKVETDQRQLVGKQLFTLLRGARASMGSTGGPGDAWTTSIGRDVRRYRKLTEVEEYLRAKPADPIRAKHRAEEVSNELTPADQAEQSGQLGTDQIRLGDQTWTIGESVGSGGFSQVFAASSQQVPSAVAKFIPKEPRAEREVWFEIPTSARNIVPIIDRGEVEGHWVLVMPRAEQSLRERLDEAGGAVDIAEALIVLSDIATALSDLASDVVHRDLKPENVLILEGRWCLADFGIARYAEAVTGTKTWKQNGTPQYTAPERWRGERATAASDVYSVGVMAYEMLAGVRPFEATTEADFRTLHLEGRAPMLAEVPTPLAALIEECLLKAPSSRPSAGELLNRLGRVTVPPSSPGLVSLQEANAEEVSRRAEAARLASAAQTAQERRSALALDGEQILDRIATDLLQAVCEAAPTTKVGNDGNGGWSLRLNDAEMRLVRVSLGGQPHWGDWQPPAFDVASAATLAVSGPTAATGYRGRSHSLWYCDAQEVDRFGWFETAFMNFALSSQPEVVPFGLNPSAEAAQALWPGMAEYQAAWPFTRLLVGELDDFIGRWAGWFSTAARGGLSHPHTLPEQDPAGTWRRS